MTEVANFRLPFSEGQTSVDARLDALDRAGREHAVDPRFNVALEASAGTGKTRVLVTRYVNLLRAGVVPRNILAITFTRKAAAEMRERIVGTLRNAAATGEIAPALWRELRDHATDISISTIDAFCLSLLREFPLEADLDPDFSMADETEVPRLVDESLDRALRVCRAVAKEDPDVALVFAQLGDRRARTGLAALLNRRLVARDMLAPHFGGASTNLNIGDVSGRTATALLATLGAMKGGLDEFIASGPRVPAFQLLARDLRKLADSRQGADPIAVQLAVSRLREYFMTQEGVPRNKLIHAKAKFANETGWRLHRTQVLQHATDIARVTNEHRRALNALVSRGVSRMFQIASTEYRRTLDIHAALDFSEVLRHAIGLLENMEEFAQSRFRLESRYHHVLVDEFQDTSRAQWKLISLLVRSWGEGAGLAHAGPLHPSIFIVGDRKQSIYGFRDADASILKEASQFLVGLRSGQGAVRRAISRSFRSVPPLLAFVNDVCHDIEKAPARRDAFAYEEQDQFPIDASPNPGAGCAMGIVAASTVEECAELTAAEIAGLIASETTVRDRETGIHRAIQTGDIAILFRSRESHREFETALERRGISAYVYKGLGFFDADEVKDVLALLWYLAEPLSNRRAAAFMRSRFVRLSDEGLRLLAPGLAETLDRFNAPAAGLLDSFDAAALAEARTFTRRWRQLVDRLPPAELLDTMMAECAYLLEIRGPRFAQAWENLKKLRGLIRRIQNRGYTTLAQLTASLERLAVGDDSNAVIDAADAVNLMTVHASKGLEFPVVFLVNVGRGTGNRRSPIRLCIDGSDESSSVAVGDFQSEADEDQAQKDREETKRLLYVALTRARDRLYLGAVLKDGQLEPGRGSLAEVLPSSLIDAFSLPSVASDKPGADVDTWMSSTGRVHIFRRCVVTNSSERIPLSPAVPRDSDFDPAVDRSARRQTISAALSQTSGGIPDSYSGAASDRLVGTLVHRLLQKLGFEAGNGNQLRPQASALLRPDERASSTDEDGVVEDAVRAYQSISVHPEVRAVYACADRWHEVPFTMRVENGWLRGTIDCLVRTGDGLKILEFKTGISRPHHAAQLDFYRQAVKRLFPDLNVEARLIYADEQ